MIVTHANGDHFWGAGVLPDAEIIATREAREHIHYEPTPKQQHALVQGGDPATVLGEYLKRHFGTFDWSQTEPVQPTTYFTGELELTLGEYPVQISALPAAHTTGDLIVHLLRSAPCSAATSSSPPHRSSRATTRCTGRAPSPM